MIIIVYSTYFSYLTARNSHNEYDSALNLLALAGSHFRQKS